MITTALAGFQVWMHSKQYSKSSIASYKKRVLHYLNWITTENIAATAVNYTDILRYIELLKVKQNMHTIQGELSAVHAYYQYLQHTGQHFDNPVAYVELQGVKKQQLHNIIPYSTLEQLYHQYGIQRSYEGKVPPQQLNELSRSRNKIILGLLVYQGLTTTDLQLLQTTDVHLRTGSMEMPSSRKYAHRKMMLQSFQLYELMEYIQDGRKQLLQHTGKQTTQLLISSGSGNALQNTLQYLIGQITAQHPEITSLQQIRASVIVHWLQQHSLRKVQYMAGHKYISATEAYKVYCTQALTDEINKFHPMG